MGPSLCQHIVSAPRSRLRVSADDVLQPSVNYPSAPAELPDVLGQTAVVKRSQSDAALVYSDDDPHMQPLHRRGWGNLCL